MENEIWKDIDGYEGLYQVSSGGRIRRMASSVLKSNGIYYNSKCVIRKPFITSVGYYMITLSKSGRINQYVVHRLIAAAFIPNPENKPQVNHKNLDKKDNRLDNLEWVTVSENAKHYVASGRFRPPCRGRFGSKHHLSKPIHKTDLKGNILESFDAVKTAARKLGTTSSNICSCLKGRNKTHLGFKWIYAAAKQLGLSESRLMK
jgi:hypothetical protein